MAVDLTVVPWDRLAKLSPPGTTNDDLQAAANRWALRADIYNAAADLWEEAAYVIDTSLTDDEATSQQVVSKVSQDGISVEYASDALAGNNRSSRVATQAKMLATAKRLRAKGKPGNPLVHDPDYDPWLNTELPQESQIIIVDEV